MILFLNSLFWALFFMVGFVSIGDRLALKTTGFWGHFNSDKNLDAIFALYAVAAILILRLLYENGTTSFLTMINLHFSIVLFASVTLKYARSIILLLIAVSILMLSFHFSSLMIGLAVLFSTLLLAINRNRAYLQEDNVRFFEIIMLYDFSIWLTLYYLNQLKFSALAMQILCFFTVNCFAYLYSTSVRQRKTAYAKLSYQSTHDVLTDCFNRKQFIIDLRHLRVIRKQTALILLDLDYFKTINDTYGHLVGDLVLVDFAKQLNSYVESFEKQFTCYRTGGEEFHLLMPATTTEQAVLLMKNFQTNLIPIPLPQFEAEILLTISAGVTELKLTDLTIHTTITRADDLLYEAKRAGRNLVLGHSKT